MSAAAADSLSRGTPVLVRGRTGVIRCKIESYEVVYGPTDPSEIVETAGLVRASVSPAETNRLSRILTNWERAKVSGVVSDTVIARATTDASKKTPLKRAGAPYTGPRRESRRQRGQSAENGSDNKTLAQADRTHATESDDDEDVGNDRGTVVKTKNAPPPAGRQLYKQELVEWQQKLDTAEREYLEKQHGLQAFKKDLDKFKHELDTYQGDQERKLKERKKELDKKEAVVNAKRATAHHPRQQTRDGVLW